jgi:hypothetical protein
LVVVPDDDEVIATLDCADVGGGDPPLLAWRATRREQAIHRTREDITVLPRHGLAKRRVSGDVAQTSLLVVGTEGVKTGDRKAGAANREVAAQSPISAKRDQVAVHRADPRSIASN